MMNPKKRLGSLLAKIIFLLSVLIQLTIRIMLISLKLVIK